MSQPLGFKVCHSKLSLDLKGTLPLSTACSTEIWDYLSKTEELSPQEKIDRWIFGSQVGSMDQVTLSNYWSPSNHHIHGRRGQTSPLQNCRASEQVGKYYCWKADTIQYITHQNLKWYISHFTLKSPQNCSTYDGSKVQFTPIILAGGLRLFAWLCRNWIWPQCYISYVIKWFRRNSYPYEKPLSCRKRIFLYPDVCALTKNISFKKSACYWMQILGNVDLF